MYHSYEAQESVHRHFYSDLCLRNQEDHRILNIPYGSFLNRVVPVSKRLMRPHYLNK